MKPIPFKGCNVVVAKDQPQYNPMPGLSFGDDDGTKLFCYQLTWKERITILLTGKLWQFMLTFNQPQQPQRFTVDTPLCVVCTDLPSDFDRFTCTVSKCAACGMDHEEMEWLPSWTALDNGYTHESACPVSGMPVFCREVEGE